MCKWNSNYALNAHLGVSAVSLILLQLFSSGTHAAFVFSRIPALIITGIVLALVIPTLVMCFFPDAEYKGRPRLVRVLVILAVDLFLLPLAIFTFVKAFNGLDEFWGEDRLPENCQPFDELVSREVTSNLTAKAVHDEAEPGNAWLGSSEFRDLLVGAVNPGEQGELFVRIVDLESDGLLFESPRWSAPWSQNEGEVFPFACHYWIRRGRGDTWYVARCELWFVSPKREEKLISRRLKVRGWY